MERSEILFDLKSLGYSVIEDYLQEEFLVRLRADLEDWIQTCDIVREQNGLGGHMRGTAHHILGREDSMAAFIKRLPLHDVLKGFFNGAYILNSFGGLKYCESREGSYDHVSRYHRDVRTYSKEIN